MAIYPQPRQQPMVQSPLQHAAQQQSPPQPGQLKKRRKKKSVNAAGLVSGGAAAPTPSMVQPSPGTVQPASVPSGMPAMMSSVEPIPLPVQTPPVVPVPVAPATKQKKVGRCWKCAVNTHATKDFKVIHYCLVCDSGAHPTIRCPILKLPKPMSFFVGCGNDVTLDLHLPDSVYMPQLIPLEHLQPWYRCQERGLSQRQIFRVLWPACVLKIPHGSLRRWLIVLTLFWLGSLQKRTFRGLMVCRWVCPR
jgi:hypothetical protein